MHVYRAEDRAAVQAIIDNDPFMIHDVVATAVIRELVPLLGQAVPALTGVPQGS